MSNWGAEEGINKQDSIVLNPAEIEAHLRPLITHETLGQYTKRSVREEIERKFGLPEGSLKEQRELINGVLGRIVQDLEFSQDVRGDAATSVGVEVPTTSPEAAVAVSEVVGSEGVSRGQKRAHSDPPNFEEDLGSKGAVDEGPAAPQAAVSGVKRRRGSVKAEATGGRGGGGGDIAPGEESRAGEVAASGRSENEESGSEFSGEGSDNEADDPGDEDDDDDGDFSSDDSTYRKKPKRGAKKSVAAKKGRPQAVKHLQARMMSKAAFSEAAQAFESQIGPLNFKAEPRVFSTGSCGWFFGTKTPLPVGNKDVTCQITLNITVVGSKEWKEGKKSRR